MAEGLTQDGYGHIGSKGIEYYEAVGAAIATGLFHQDHASVDFEPGNATRYDLTFTRRATDGHIVVAWPGLRTSYNFPSLNGVHYGYLMEKFGCLPGDAAVLSLLFQAVSDAMNEVKG